MPNTYYEDDSYFSYKDLNESISALGYDDDFNFIDIDKEF